ncbi:hypothetical protein HanPSC8_Chr03g0117691 [Helianthus annuus]|nr:hypothetical protein HanPSC8_Chr03g0117691 [Helianthus annuus]
MEAELAKENTNGRKLGEEHILAVKMEQEYEKRKRLKEEWERWVNKWKRDHEEQMLRDREASDVEEAEQVEVEELLDVTEEILPDVGIFLIRSVVS